MEEEAKRYALHDKGGGTDEVAPEQKADIPLAGRSEDRPLPGAGEEAVIDFSTLVMSFAGAAMISLGHMPDPMTGRINKDLVLARQNIAIISLLEEKTAGNLSGEEKELVRNVLYRLRMSFVESQKG